MPHQMHVITVLRQNAGSEQPPCDTEYDCATFIVKFISLAVCRWLQCRAIAVAAAAHCGLFTPACCCCLTSRHCSCTHHRCHCRTRQHSASEARHVPSWHFQRKPWRLAWCLLQYNQTESQIAAWSGQERAINTHQRHDFLHTCLTLCLVSEFAACL
jgi:hypothetical protein